MEIFAKLFERFLVFVYHCFDRIVIQGYLPLLTRPEHIVHFFRDVHGLYPITPQVLAKRTSEYRGWVEGYARNHRIPILKAEKGVSKEDAVRPYLQRMERRNQVGVYCIFTSMEMGSTFTSKVPKYPTEDPDYRIIRRGSSRYLHYSLENPPLRARRRAGLWLGVKLNFISEMLKPFHEVAFQAL